MTATAHLAEAMSGWRSLLFTAADDAKRLARVAERGADAVILDLEDAVPVERKSSARAGLGAAIDALARAGQRVVVRINAGWRDAFADLEVAIRPGVAALMIPKMEDAGRLTALARITEELAVGTAPGLIALVESPAGIGALSSIAAAPGLCGLAFGSEDFSLALGVPPTREALDLPCRMVALAAASQGLAALGLPISIATIADDAAWSAAIASARAIGMTGALCIHPRQIGPVNVGFAASATEIEAARRVIDAWAQAQGAGVVQVDGRMIDLPVVLAARRLLSAQNARRTRSDAVIAAKLADQS